MIRTTLTAWIVVGAIISANSAGAFGQSRHKVIHFKPAAVTRTQFSPDAAPAAATGDAPSLADAVPSARPMIASRSNDDASTQNEPTAAGFDFSQMNSSAPKPSLQQIQNPSGGYQMDYWNMSQGAYTMPNTYMGTQFNSWNNIQMQPIGLSEFEAFNRTQPPNSGWYVSPNTYVGAGFNTWNNLSSGYITPNYLGSWTYQN